MIEHVNKIIENNSYLFNDFKKEGVMLYDSGQYQFPSPKKFSLEKRKQQQLKSLMIILAE
jgi:hypothetical protein